MLEDKVFYTLVLAIVVFQIASLCFVKTRIYGPFKVITVYSLLFESLRYFYVYFGLSTFDLSSGDWRDTFLFMVLSTTMISWIALVIELSVRPSSGIRFKNNFSLCDYKAANIVFYISLAALCCVCVVRYVKYGWIIEQSRALGWTDDVWAGLYILKIPMLFCVASLIINIHLKRYGYILIGLIQVILLVLIDGERSVLFFVTLSIGLYFVATRRISWSLTSLLVGIVPFVFYWLTLRRFSDASSLEIFSQTWEILDLEIALSILQQSYGRYYALEGTHLMFEGSNHLRDQFNNSLYIAQNLVPFAQIGDSNISVSRLVCQSIDFGRWNENVSCWAYFPAVVYFDSGILGLLISVLSLLIIFYFWVKGAYSQHILYFSIFALVFPKLLFVLNFTIASLFEFGYYGAYFIFIMLAARINFKKVYQINSHRFMISAR